MNTVNPFFHRGPIRDTAYFYGRQNETKQVLALLANGQSVSIVAPRRMGKTSLLFHLSLAEVCAQNGLSPERYCFVYLDCEGWQHLESSDLYLLLLEETQDALVRTGHSAVLPTLPPSPINYRTFERALGAIARVPIQLIFMLDEFEALSTNSHLDADFFSGLRGLATKHGVAYVTASVEPLLSLTYAQTSVLSSPFFNIFAHLRLRLFTPADAQAMLTELAARVGLAFTQDELNFFLDLAGPHPFLLQIVAYHAVDVTTSMGYSLDEASRDQVCRLFLAEAEAHWTYAWNSLTPQDQKALALLLITVRSDPMAVQRLEAAGLVRQYGGEIVPLSPKFQAFVSRQPVAGLLQAPPVTLDLVQRATLRRGHVLKLPSTEFDLLALLMMREGQVLSFSDMAAAIWPSEAQVDNTERIKDVLKNLRKLLDEDADCIQNVRGQGYFFSG